MAFRSVVELHFYILSSKTRFAALRSVSLRLQSLNQKTLTEYPIYFGVFSRIVFLISFWFLFWFSFDFDCALADKRDLRRIRFAAWRSVSLRLQSLNQKTLTEYHRFISESFHGSFFWLFLFDFFFDFLLILIVPWQDKGDYRRILHEKNANIFFSNTNRTNRTNLHSSFSSLHCAL